jgi:cysteine-rich repeat protein
MRSQSNGWVWQTLVAVWAISLCALLMGAVSCACIVAADDNEIADDDEFFQDGAGDEGREYDIEINICGDELTNGMEECDDGNLIDGDGCSSICVLEDGWDCGGQPTTCIARPPNSDSH